MRPRRLLVLALATTLVVAVVMPVGLWYLRLHPLRIEVDDDPAAHGLAYEPVAFTSRTDGTTLRGWYLPASRATGRTIVIVPGIDDNRQVGGVTLDLAPALLAAGFDVLAFDLRGEGESGGGPITFGAREQGDVLAAVAEARARGATRVGVLGFSLGSAAAILAAASAEGSAGVATIDALATDSAFADLTVALRRELERIGLPSPIIDYGFLFYPLLSGTDTASVSPVAAIGAIAPRPVLLIHGTADETVPVEDSERLVAAADPATTERWPVTGGRHTKSYFVDPEAYAARVTTFFERAMP